MNALIPVVGENKIIKRGRESERPGSQRGQGGRRKIGVQDDICRRQERSPEVQENEYKYAALCGGDRRTL